MPRTKPVPSQKEIDLMLRIRGYVDVLILKHLAFGTLGVVAERSAKDLDKALRKLTPGLHSNHPKDEEGELNKEFFETLSLLLKELGDNKNSALRTVNWRAADFGSHSNGLAKLF